MAVFKGKFETSFAVIPNEALQDKALSFEATGLLAMMLSLPDDWAIHKSWLQQQKIKCGRDKLTSMMNELIDAGYVVRKVKQKEDGRLDGVDWEVFPTVQLKNRKTVKPSDGKSDTTKETVIQKKHSKRSLVPSETKRSKFKFNDNDLKLAEWMFSRVLVINPSAKKPNHENWANTVRLMREIDNRTHAEISGLFDWANKDSFWCSNILSPEKLRKQWDKLTVKRGSNEGHQSNSKLRQQATDGLSDSQRAIAAARAQRDGNTEASRSPMGSNGSVVYEQVGQDEWSDSQQLVAKGNSEPF